MEANELRIGNLVNYELMDSECKVRGLGEDCLWLNGTKFGGPVGIDLFKPIPLTEEWLLKFGFSNIEGEFRMDMPNPFNNKSVFESIIFFQDGDGFAQFIIQESGEDLGMTHNSFVPVKIEYVHQLQNLYFALTGTELV